MYTSQLFYILSALAAITVQAAPSHPPAESVVVDTPLPSAVSYAGAPANGEYPDEVAANGGWESDSPTYDTAAATVVWSATISADGSYATPIHGSGSMPATDMNSCYQMCQAQFAPAAPASPAPSGSAASSAVSAGTTGAPSAPASASAAPAPAGSGATPQGGSKTHTIIVAPTQGVLRFVPFAVKAEQGDSLEYIWGGGPHSATLSDGTNICNKSTEAGAFDSGKLNATETFTAVYDKNTTGPTFYYCTVGQHCANGMFGIINPPTSNVSNALTDKATSSGPPRPDSTAGSGSKLTPGVDGWVTSWGLTWNPDNQKKVDAVKAACKGAPGSWAWGSNWDWEPMLSDTVTKEVIIQNTLYTRLMASYNPAMIKGEALTADWKAAPDLTSFAASYTGGPNVTMSGGSASGTGESPASASVSPTAAIGIAASGNGAGQIGGSSAVLALSVGFVGLALSFL